MEAKESSKGRRSVRLGFDFGINTSVIACDQLQVPFDQIPTVLGYPKPGLLASILPRGKTVLFGHEALEHHQHLELRWPLRKGMASELQLARDFLYHIRQLIDPKGELEIWATVGCPAQAESEKLRILRACASEVFERVIIAPEPFLAVLGLRDDATLEDPNYLDPCLGSLVVDIGAGTTDFCIVQGWYPGPEDQFSVYRAGNDIDTVLYQLLSTRYPDWTVRGLSITKIKEDYSFVGEPAQRARVEVFIGGKRAQVDVTDQVRDACLSLMPEIVKNIERLLKQCDSDSVERVLRNIVLTGGGSRIRGIDTYLQSELIKDGFALARVRCAEDYKKVVARGALKMALAASEQQWQVLIKV